MKRNWKWTEVLNQKGILSIRILFVQIFKLIKNYSSLEKCLETDLSTFHILLWSCRVTLNIMKTMPYDNSWCPDFLETTFQILLDINLKCVCNLVVWDSTGHYIRSMIITLDNELWLVIITLVIIAPDIELCKISITFVFFVSYFRCSEEYRFEEKPDKPCIKVRKIF